MADVRLPLAQCRWDPSSNSLLRCTDVPSEQQVPFILQGYRSPPENNCGLFRSLFALHNETGNIWTHLVALGYVMFVGAELVVEFVSDFDLMADPEVLWVLALVAATALCFFFSVLYHLCCCASSGVRHCTLQMDLTGILVLIAFSYFAGIAVGYRCFPAMRDAYLAYAALVTALISAPMLLPPQYLFGAGTTTFFILGVTLGLLPAVHFLFVASAEQIRIGLPYLVLLFGFYGAGAGFYVTRFPERRWPGRFDLVGHSHQIWHIFVVLAALSWVRGCSDLLRSASCPSEGNLLAAATTEAPAVSAVASAVAASAAGSAGAHVAAAVKAATAEAAKAAASPGSSAAALVAAAAVSGATSATVGTDVATQQGTDVDKGDLPVFTL